MEKVRPFYYLRNSSTKKLIELFEIAVGKESFDLLFTTKKLWASDFYYAYAVSKSGKKMEEARAIWIAGYLLDSFRTYLFEIEKLSKAEVEKKLLDLFSTVDFSECFDTLRCKACGQSVKYSNLYLYLNDRYCDHIPNSKNCCHCSRFQSLQVLYISGVKQRTVQGAVIDEFLTRKSVWLSTGPFCYLCGVETFFEIPTRIHWKTAEPQMAEIDHVIPLSKGGNHDVENTAIACSSCNKEKADKLLGT